MFGEPVGRLEVHASIKDIKNLQRYYTNTSNQSSEVLITREVCALFMRYFHSTSNDWSRITNILKFQSTPASLAVQ